MSEPPGPRVLVTNDDGLSEGLHALRTALVGVAASVVTVVPDRNRSGNSRALTLPEPVIVEEVDDDPALGRVLVCSGSPLDCVRVGLLSDIARSADVVVSGINHGANLGDDVHYSGTCGAALEAALLDRPGIAISQVRSGIDWFTAPAPMPPFDTATRVAVRLVEALGRHPLPARHALTVNVPAAAVHERPVAARLGRRHQRDLTLVPGPVTPDGRTPYRLWDPEMGEPGRDEGDDTDFAVVARGEVAVSLLSAVADPAPGPAGARAWLAGLSGTTPR
jgi:5'-nucleotidase